MLSFAPHLGATTDGTTALVLVGLVLVAAALAWGFDQRRRRLMVEAFVRSEQARASQQGNEDPIGDALQKRIGDLHVAKLEAELELLRRQVNSKDLDDDRTAAGKEAHELMVEKMRLEIDSLRLHIVEQRKRMDVWRDDEGL